MIWFSNWMNRVLRVAHTHEFYHKTFKSVESTAKHRLLPLFDCILVGYEYCYPIAMTRTISLSMDKNCR